MIIEFLSSPFQLAASRSLYFHIDDANFSESGFLDLLPLCWDLCFNLIEEVQEFDSKVPCRFLLKKYIEADNLKLELRPNIPIPVLSELQLFKIPCLTFAYFYINYLCS